MAIVSSAIAAVATLATAVTSGVAAAGGALAVAGAAATLVGTVGLGVAAVGLATGNKDLQKAGGIMGLVGLGGNLLVGGLQAAGFGAGAASTAAGGVAKEATESVAKEAAGEVTKELGETTTAAALAKPEIGQQVVQGVSGTPAPFTDTGLPLPQPGGSIANAPLASGARDFLRETGQGAASAASAVAPPAVAPPSIAPPPASVGPLPSVQPPPLTSVAPAPAAPAAASALQQEALGRGIVAGTSGALSGGAGAPAATTMPDWAKYALAAGGVQAAGGLLSGALSGLSAEKRLELEQLQLAQQQEQLDWLRRNAGYAPRLNFYSSYGTPTGLIGRA